jgi:hypothetical protein
MMESLKEKVDLSEEGKVNYETLMSKKEFLRKFPFIRKTTLNWQIYRAEDLGLSSAFIRPFNQRMILISPEAYFGVMMKQHDQSVRVYV